MGNSNNRDAESRQARSPLSSEVEPTAATEKRPPGKFHKRRWTTYFTLSVASMASLTLTVAIFMPPLGSTQSEKMALPDSTCLGVVDCPNAPTNTWQPIAPQSEVSSGVLMSNPNGDISDAMRPDELWIGNIGNSAHGLRDYVISSELGRRAGTHPGKAPRVRMGAVQVSGRLPKEVVHRIVRQYYGRFRLCYEQGLAAKPQLTGSVSVRFTVDRKGAVSSVTHEGSSLPDTGVVSCVARTFYGLTFPKPEGGIVTVVYPISFEPG